MKNIMIPILVLVLSACSNHLKQLEEQGDWYQVGYQDGVIGHTQRSAKELTDLNSSKYADYEQGYLEGVSEYCNPNFAYQIGLSGQYYHGVCEGSDTAQRFRMEWQRGWNEHQN